MVRARDPVPPRSPPTYRPGLCKVKPFLATQLLGYCLVDAGHAALEREGRPKFDDRPDKCMKIKATNRKLTTVRMSY